MYYIVIASEAKQSIITCAKLWIAASEYRLAMTESKDGKRWVRDLNLFNIPIATESYFLSAIIFFPIYFCKTSGTAIVPSSC